MWVVFKTCANSHPDNYTSADDRCPIGFEWCDEWYPFACASSGGWERDGGSVSASVMWRRMCAEIIEEAE